MFIMQLNSFRAEFNNHDHDDTCLVINVIPLKIVSLGLYTMSPAHALLETWRMPPMILLESW
jgi:hypothetical protein